MASKPSIIVPADGAEASTKSDFRKAPTDLNRIPGSAASMKVQERSKTDPSSSSSSSSTSTSKPTPSSSSNPHPSSAAIRSRSAIQAMQPLLDSTTNSDSPIQPTDIQLLTTSIVSNQERQRVILFYQERLIESEPSLSELKQSLLFLSSSSWGQILEERKLAEKCSYPPCPNESPSSASRKRGNVGRFRINLRNKSVKAVEDLDLGEAGNTWDDLRDYFCSKGCYARSEWILRWVLEDKEIGFAYNGESGGKKGGGAGGVLGGKWQKLTSHPGGWKQVELLEDIERESGVCLDAVEDEEGLLDGVKSTPQDDDVIGGVMGAEENSGKNLMGNLKIIERPRNTAQPSPATNGNATPTQPLATTIIDAPQGNSTTTLKSVPKTKVESRTAYDVDVPNTLGARFSSNPSLTTTASSRSTTAERDFEDELDQQERELSHILRFASMATGSKPRPRNTTIRFDNDNAASQTSTLTAAVGGANDGRRAKGERDEDSDGEADEPVIHPKEAAERKEMKKLMEFALNVRRDQRELGLLD